MFIYLSGRPTPALRRIYKSVSCSIGFKGMGVINEINLQRFWHFQTSSQHYSQLTYCIPCSSPYSEYWLSLSCCSIFGAIMFLIRLIIIWAYQTNGCLVLACYCLTLSQWLFRVSLIRTSERSVTARSLIAFTVRS